MTIAQSSPRKIVIYAWQPVPEQTIRGHYCLSVGLSMRAVAWVYDLPLNAVRRMIRAAGCKRKWSGRRNLISKQVSVLHHRPIMTQPTTYAKVESALFTLATHRADDRAEWIRIGQAIHEWNDDQDTFDLWMRWSQTSAKCKPNELARIWPGFQPGKGITVATLFGAAHEDGWMWTEGNGGDREERDSSPATPPSSGGRLSLPLVIAAARRRP